MKRMTLLVALLSLFVVAPVAAQEPTPVPGKAASKLLPAASLLGEGWSQSRTVSPEVLAPYVFKMSPDAFSEGAAGTYLGPNGARVLIVSLILTDSRVSIRRAWDDASKLLDALDSQATTDYQRQQDLESMAPPKGCAEAKRLEGTDDLYVTPVGATMCAVGSDVIVLVVVSGSLHGNAIGIVASDSVVQQIATEHSGATPRA